MKIILKFKNLIILISIISILKGFFLTDFVSKNKDYKDKYGVYLVLAEWLNKIHLIKKIVRVNQRINSLFINSYNFFESQNIKNLFFTFKSLFFNRSFNLWIIYIFIYPWYLFAPTFTKSTICYLYHMFFNYFIIFFNFWF